MGKTVNLQDPPGLLEVLLSVEARGAALHAALEADPELGAIWRAQAALSEAAASVRLEDIAVFEGDILVRDFEVRANEPGIARGVEAALGLLKVLARPGRLDRDPEEAVLRCWREGQIQPPDDLMGGEILQDREAEEPPAGTGAAVLEAAGKAPTAFLAGLRGALCFRQATLAARPAAERLVFTLCEQSWRQGRMTDADPLDGLVLPFEVLSGIDSRWVLLPSQALSGRGFRAWAPMSVTGVADLVARLDHQLSREIGRLPVLRRWRSRALALTTGRHGRCRSRDLVATVMRQPVVTTSSLAAAIGVTGRTALNLINEAVGAGVLAPIVARRTWRSWAVAPLAEILRARSLPAPARHLRPDAERARDASPPEMAPTGALPRRSPAEIQAGEEKVLAALDAAMRSADEVLARYGRSGPGGRASRRG